jgi:hypothetical protein
VKQSFKMSAENLEISALVSASAILRNSLQYTQIRIDYEWWIQFRVANQDNALSIIIADREIERLLTMGRFIVTETVRIERENEQERRRRRQERNNN